MCWRRRHRYLILLILFCCFHKMFITLWHLYCFDQSITCCVFMIFVLVLCILLHANERLRNKKLKLCLFRRGRMQQSWRVYGVRCVQRSSAAKGRIHSDQNENRTRILCMWSHRLYVGLLSSPAWDDIVLQIFNKLYNLLSIPIQMSFLCSLFFVYLTTSFQCSSRHFYRQSLLRHRSVLSCCVVWVSQEPTDWLVWIKKKLSHVVWCL